MTTTQMVARLKPLRAEVHNTRRRVLSQIAAGAPTPRCQPILTAWREAVQAYLEELGTADVDRKQLRKFGRQVRRDLEANFDIVGNGVEGWQADRRIEDLVTQYEVAADLNAGAEATRQWLLTQDARLRQGMRRNDQKQPLATSQQEMEAIA